MLEVFFGSGLGGTFRYLLSLLATRLFGVTWPGTLFVNTLGALILIGLGQKMESLGAPWARFFNIGLLGGFTTFSTFSSEIFQKINQGKITEALVIFGLNIILGIIIGIFVFR